MFKTILVPVDITEPEMSSQAIETAVSLANQSAGTVRLVYVRSLIPVTYMEFVPPDFDMEQQQDAEQKLAQIAAGVPMPEDRISTVVRLGAVYAEVLEEADKTAADLIVVGSHRPKMSTYLLGSNAATIVRHARCSVLVIRR
jgi:nucleotide-binding universal stress UspA family protein